MKASLLKSWTKCLESYANCLISCSLISGSTWPWSSWLQAQEKWQSGCEHKYFPLTYAVLLVYYFPLGFNLLLHSNSMKMVIHCLPMASSLRPESCKSLHFGSPCGIGQTINMCSCLHFMNSVTVSNINPVWRTLPLSLHPKLHFN